MFVVIYEQIMNHIDAVFGIAVVTVTRFVVAALYSFIHSVKIARLLETAE